MSPDTIHIGNAVYNVVWLQAKIRRSHNEQVYIVRLEVPGLKEPALFYATEDEVRLSTPTNGEEVAGEIKALLLDEPSEDQVAVLVSGDAVSYGPTMVVPRSLAG